MRPFFKVKLHALEAKDASKLSEEVEKSCMEELDNVCKWRNPVLLVDCKDANIVGRLMCPVNVF